MEQNTQKYIGSTVVVIVLVVALGVFLLKNKEVNSPASNTDIEMKDDMNPDAETPDKNTTIAPDKTEVNSSGVNMPSNLTKEQQNLLTELKKTADASDFEAFALVLEQVYKNQWSGIEDFRKIESEFYVYATDTYWKKGDLENSLKVSTIVYGKVPEAWRFRYLRIVTLEKYGRNALNAGDLKTAENYAMQILQMMFRPEGANLLADVYISKIRTNIKDGNTNLAKQNLDFISGFEASQDRRDRLNELKTEIEGMK